MVDTSWPDKRIPRCTARNHLQPLDLTGLFTALIKVLDAVGLYSKRNDLDAVSTAVLPSVRRKAEISGGMPRRSTKFILRSAKCFS